MVDVRQKNKIWRCANSDGSADYEQAKLATLMDIRDELQSLNRLFQCYRIPKALDALIEVGADIRRKKRAAAKKRKLARSRSAA
jgi:hypothetical protein